MKIYRIPNKKITHTSQPGMLFIKIPASMKKTGDEKIELTYTEDLKQMVVRFE